MKKNNNFRQKVRDLSLSSGSLPTGRWLSQSVRFVRLLTVSMTSTSQGCYEGRKWTCPARAISRGPEANHASLIWTRSSLGSRTTVPFIRAAEACSSFSGCAFCGGCYKGAIQVSEGMGTTQPSSLKAPGCPPSVPPKHFAWGTVYLYLSYEIAGKQKGFLCTFWYWRIEPDGGLWSECRSAPKGHRLGLPGNHILFDCSDLSG